MSQGKTLSPKIKTKWKKKEAPSYKWGHEEVSLAEVEKAVFSIAGKLCEMRVANEARRVGGFKGYHIPH